MLFWFTMQVIIEWYKDNLTVVINLYGMNVEKSYLILLCEHRLLMTSHRKYC